MISTTYNIYINSLIPYVGPRIQLLAHYVFVVEGWIQIHWFFTFSFIFVLKHRITNLLQR